MSPEYRVYWAGVAEDDLKGIVEFIAEDNPAVALAVLKKIRKRASSLTRFPQRGRIVPELKAQGVVLYRELVVPPWRITYRVSGKKVYVLSVLDSRQNIEDVLLKRLL